MSIFSLIFEGIGETALEIGVAIMPIIIIFIILNQLYFKVKMYEFKRIMTGFFITFLGLILFMQGVHIAYVPVGTHLGLAISQLDYNWILIPIGFLIGFLVAFAEPAVHVVVKQVETATAGTIKATRMLLVISLGVAVAVCLSMTRLVFDFSLWWMIIPGYVLVFILGRKVNNFFLGLAFDNGGVATGPMCSTFIISFAVAVATGMDGRNPLLDGFGVVAMIALAPILATIILGLVYEHSNKKNKRTRLSDTIN